MSSMDVTTWRGDNFGIAEVRLSLDGNSSVPGSMDFLIVIGYSTGNAGGRYSVPALLRTPSLLRTVASLSSNLYRLVSNFV